MICPTCKTEAGDQVCMCGKCPSCDPKHFNSKNTVERYDEFDLEIRANAERILAEGDNGEVEF